MADLLEECGVSTGPAELLGAAGDLPVYALEEDSPDAAVARWQELRAVHLRSGLWPVVLGAGEEVGETFSFAEGGEHDPDAVARGEATTAAEVLGPRLAAEPDGALEERPELPAEVDPLPATWVLDDGPCLVGLVPAAAGWQVPGLVTWWGAANHDLGPAEHVAVLRDWEARYGAELAVLTFDVVQLAVARPPRVAADVLAAAQAQYAYCPDVVDQGVGTLEALCREQVVRRSWYFWWD